MIISGGRRRGRLMNMRVGVVDCLGVVRRVVRRVVLMAGRILVVLELAVHKLALGFADRSRVDTVDSPYWEHLH